MTMGSSEDLLQLSETRANLTNRAYSRASLLMGCQIQVGGEGCEVIDAQGSRYLDAFDAYGNQSFGYGHPEIVAALRRQLDSGHTNSCKIFFEHGPVQLAKQLAELTDYALPCSYLTNGGAEAIDGALKLARACTGRSKIVTMRDCYHGKTFAALSAAGRSKYAELYGPLVPDFVTVPFGDLESFCEAADDTVAAVLLEVVQGEGGIRLPPPGYLPEMRAICDRLGIVLIVDEIQSAFGRTGTFFAYQRFGIVPDIICIGKSFGGGMLPISAFLSTKECWKAFEVAPVSFGSSLGGNPLAVAVGSTTVEIAGRDDFLQAVRRKEAKVENFLRAIENQYSPVLVGARGIGLLWGLEFVDAAAAGLFVWRLSQRHVLTSFCLFNPSVVRLQPPLVISDAELEQVLEAYEAALADVAHFHASRVDDFGQSQFTLAATVTGDVSALWEYLRDPLHLYSTLIPHQSVYIAKEMTVTCSLSADGTDMRWSDRIDVSQPGLVRQHATDGDWTRFSRCWRVAAGAEPGTVDLTVTVAWDAGTVEFESTLSMRVRWSLEKQYCAALNALRIMAGTGRFQAPARPTAGAIKTQI